MGWELVPASYPGRLFNEWPEYEAKLVHVHITSLVPRPCACSSLAVQNLRILYCKRQMRARPGNEANCITM